MFKSTSLTDEESFRPLPLREGAGGGVRASRGPAPPEYPLPLIPPTRGGGKEVSSALLIAIIAVLPGCKSPPESPLPTYTLTNERETLAAFTTRSAGITSVQAQATIELTDENKQTVHLDAAMLLQSPDRVRLRAWKFGTAVFDLTVRGEQAWAYVPRDEARPAMPAARESITKWLRLLQGEITSSSSQFSLRDNDLIVDTPTNGGTLHCTIDRRTLTATSYVLLDRAGRERFRLALADYQQLAGGRVWPMTITATSQQGIIAIHASDVSLNEPLPRSAFDPPARADVLP